MRIKVNRKDTYADHSVTFRPFGRYLRTKAKIGEFNITVDAEENIIGLDVTMNNMSAVKEL